MRILRAVQADWEDRSAGRRHLRVPVDTPNTHRPGGFVVTRSLSALAVLATLPLGTGAAEPLAGKKPNIVFVLTDDQGYGDVSAHGNPVLKTPNLDRLRADSVRFTDFHVSPTCSPTRSALMTGRHEFKNGVTHTILERERLTPRATKIGR